MKWNKII